MNLVPRALPGGLVYAPDDAPGITRRRCGRGFAYFDPAGRLIRDPEDRARIAALAVPPAWEEVWIAPLPEAHLQATGRDARGRKQYRYHPDWAAHRAALKHDRLADFGRALPRLRSFIAERLRAPAGSVDLALGLVLALIDRAAIRVGNPEYAAENRSYGATTLRRRHLRLEEGRARLAFPSKGGRPVRRVLRGARLMRALARLHELPGAELACWRDAAGTVHALRSDQVNAAIARVCGADHSAKTFRTWAGTHAAFAVALRPGPLTLGAMLDAAAERLANTPAVARRSYVHPAVLDLARLAPEARGAMLAALDPPPLHGLHAGEAELIAVLEARARGPEPSSPRPVGPKPRS